MCKPGTFTIVQDSREKRPFCFPAPWDVRVNGLETGDYSILGFEEHVSIERKSLDDLVNCCVGRNRDRFKAELRRMKAYRCRAVVVEADMSGIMEGSYYGKVNPQSVAGSVASWTVKYEVPFLFSGKYGAEITLALMKNFYDQVEVFVNRILDTVEETRDIELIKTG